MTLVSRVGAPVNETADSNPYVGPYPLAKGDPFFGREAEVTELENLLLSERIVLVYSPSGAGKTSLIEAGLLSRLDADSFRVLPTVRVGDSPREDHEPNGQANRYIRNTLQYLQSGTPSAGDGSAVALCELLDRQLQELNDDRDQVLFFDQFEEVLSLDPFDRAVKREFFVQLGAALDNRRRRAVFCMREEYVAGLGPYVRLIPGRFRARLWLDFLEPGQAVEAARGPAGAAGVPFAPQVAEKLVDSLQTMPKPIASRNGTSSDRYPYVDPVQLQVMCRRLWKNLAPGRTEITTED